MPEKTHISITQAELKLLVEDAIAGAFLRMGISAEQPLEMQKDMAFMRSLRTGSETIRNHGVIAGLGLLVTALGSAIWLGIKAALVVHK